MSRVFADSKKRLELLYRLQRRGFKVRLHSYEYFVREKGFVTILVLYPAEGVATLRRIPWNREASEKAASVISGLLKEMDPSLVVQVG